MSSNGNGRDERRENLETVVDACKALVSEGLDYLTPSEGAMLVDLHHRCADQLRTITESSDA